MIKEKFYEQHADFIEMWTEHKKQKKEKNEMLGLSKLKTFDNWLSG